MKVLRSQLKDLVKQCLVEILNEGLGTSSVVVQQEHRRLPTTHSSASRVLVPQKGRTPPSRPVTPPVTPMTHVVKNLAAGNPVLASIIADTAATTYVEQKNMERGSEAAAAMIQEAHGGSALPVGMDPSLLEGLDMSNVAPFTQQDKDPDPSELSPEAAAWSAILDRVQ